MTDTVTITKRTTSVGGGIEYIQADVTLGTRQYSVSGLVSLRRASAIAHSVRLVTNNQDSPRQSPQKTKRRIELLIEKALALPAPQPLTDDDL